VSDYNLNIDPEFKRLLPELQPEEFQRLEESILEEGCRDPIVIWDNTIVDGHNRYSICQKHGIPFSTTSLVFSRREEAIRWICLNQMGRRNISTELLRYQIGKRYNMEKLLSSTHNPKGKNQYSEVPSEDMIQPPGNYMGTAARIGREYNVSHFAVHTYKDIARAVDKIAEKDDRLSEHYLNGRIRIKKDDLVTISEMGKNQVHALTNSLIRQEKTSCRTEDILESLSHGRDYERENLAARERRKSAGTARPSVKDMPEFDPDGEVASLSLTIPSWNTSIDRVFNKTKMSEISEKARTQLKTELISLRESVDVVLLAIEEVSINE